MTDTHAADIAAAGEDSGRTDTNRQRLSVIHTVSWLNPDKGGPAYTVPSLAEASCRLGALPRVISLGPHSDTEASWGLDLRRPNDLEKCGFLAKLGASRSMRRTLVSSAASADVVHAHGIWMMPVVYSALAAAEAETPLVVSPRGMLDPVRLRISPRKKKLFHVAVQARAMRQAACFHATAESERDHIRTFGIDAPIAVIPNGIDLPEMPEDHRQHQQKTVLSVGRIHPIKGLDRLIAAWAAIEQDFPDWQLRIVGPDEVNHTRQLKALARRLATERISIEPPVYGADKQALYFSSDLFVLPTLSENFAVTVAEALASAVPVISTRGAPWQGLETNECGWWIEHGHEPLTNALRTAMSLPRKARADMGARGRNWMDRDFAWKGIAETMACVYLWLLGRGNRPACIDTAD